MAGTAPDTYAGGAQQVWRPARNYAGLALLRSAGRNVGTVVMTGSEGPRWYVVQTRPQAETKARRCQPGGGHDPALFWARRFALRWMRTR